MTSSPAVTASHSYFPALAPENAKRAVFEHLAETSRLAPVTAASHLEIRPAPATVSFGIAELDTFTGGLPKGCLTEIVGPNSSGRTSILLAALAAATKRGEICALIDATDSFDPSSAATAGVDLGRLLWVRCITRSSTNASASAAINPRMDSKGSPAQDDERTARKTKTFSSLLTRPLRPSRQLRESRDGYATAPTYRGAPEPSGLRSLFQPSSAHTDFPSSRANKGQRKTPAPPDRFPGTARLASCTSQKSSFEDARTRAKRLKMEDPVEQALRAADLLLQSGGFGLVAIDLADVPVKTARRVPLTTWFRFRRVIEGTSTTMLLIGEHPCAQTCASLGLKLAGQELSAIRHGLSAEKFQVLAISSRMQNPGRAARSSKSETNSLTHACLLEGLHLQAEVLRTRSARKPMNSVTRFPSKAAWTG